MKIPISNKKFSQEFLDKITEKAGEELLFTISGDLDLTSGYSDTVLAAGKNEAFFLQLGGRASFSGRDIFPLRHLGQAYVRKCWYWRACSGGKKKNLFRCTYRAASHLEAAAQYLSAASSGEVEEDALGALEDSFEKEMSVCPKCGRTLPSPGAQCVGCAGRGKILKKLWKYIRPQLGAMVLSLILSLCATALTLVPPYITQRLVDDIIPNSRLTSLYIVRRHFVRNVFHQAFYNLVQQLQTPSCRKQDRRRP